MFLENGNPLLRGNDSSFELDTPTRMKIDLSGDWRYQVEGGSSGSVKIPAAYDFAGKVDFQRTFALTAAQLDTFDLHLVALGVNYDCEISVNGEFIGSHAGGFTSFLFEIPANFLQVGENVIRVSVDNRLDARKSLPLRPSVSGIRNYGGIVFDMYLLGTPRLSIADAFVRPQTNENGTLARVLVHATVDGPQLPNVSPAGTPAAKKPATVGFYVEVVEKISGEQVGRSPVVPVKRQADTWEPVEATIVLQDPKLWSPETPDLYLLKCHLVREEGKDLSELDEYDFSCGIRKLAVEKGHLVLNGNRLILKGVDWHEQFPSRGCALTYEDREKDIVLIKNLGANVVRFVDHSPHPYMLDLCDRYGLLAMEELPLSHPPGQVMGDPAYQTLASAALTEMIMRDRNHPSLLAWGIGGDFETISPEALPFALRLVQTVRALDERPTYYVSGPGNDTCSHVVDIATADLGVPDLRRFKDQLQHWRADHKSQPVVVTGLGCEVQPWNHNGYSDQYSNEAQARFYLQHFDVVKSEDYDGAVIASFNDWKGERPSLTVHSGDPWVHTVGLVSSHRDRRLAYDAVRSVFRGERFIALSMGKSTIREPIIYVLAGFVVLIGIAYIYNANRRFRENVKRALFNSYNFFADIRDQRAVSLLHTTLLALVVSVAVAIVASSMMYHSRESWVLDNILSSVLVIDRVKALVVTLIWSPFRFILSCTLACVVGLLLLSALLWSLRWLFKTRIYAYHAYSVTIWSTAPLLVFVPVGMVLYRLMESSLYVLPAYALVALLFFWAFLRLLKGASIVLDVSPPKMYALGIGSLLCVAAVLYFYYDYTQGVSMYLPMLYRALTSAS